MTHLVLFALAAGFTQSWGLAGVQTSLFTSCVTFIRAWIFNFAVFTYCKKRTTLWSTCKQTRRWNEGIYRYNL